MGVTKILRKLSTRGAKCAAVIVAAGSATRMQGIDKIMADLDGEPLILHTLRAFQQSDDIQEIILVTREDLQEPLSQLCVDKQLSKVTKICKGGETRAASVQAGLDQISAQCGFVAIHDGARPLVTQAVIHDAIRKAAKFNAAAPGVRPHPAFCMNLGIHVRKQLEPKTSMPNAKVRSHADGLAANALNASENFGLTSSSCTFSAGVLRRNTASTNIHTTATPPNIQNEMRQPDDEAPPR